MPQIKAHDVITINASIENVWKVLTDISHYQDWWPKVVNLKVLKLNNELIGTEFETRPLGGKSFSCRVVNIVPNKEIRLSYCEGIYRGEGVWNVEGEDDLVKVSYKVDLKIVDKSIAVLSRIIPISKLHSMVFIRILKGLAQQIKSEKQFKQT
jgi:ribosome-associated toxin RatA of RatAB toxin-antitoxin module